MCWCDRGSVCLYDWIEVMMGDGGGGGCNGRVPMYWTICALIYLVVAGVDWCGRAFEVPL